MRQRDGCAGLLSNTGCSFQRTVSATDYQYMLLSVLFRIDQTVDHFGLVLSVHLKLARRSAPANGQQDRRSSVRSSGCPDLKFGSNLDDGLYLLTVIDLQAGLLRNVLPEGKQFLLSYLSEF